MINVTAMIIVAIVAFLFGAYFGADSFVKSIDKDIELLGTFRMGNTVYKAEKQEGRDGQ